MFRLDELESNILEWLWDEFNAHICTSNAHAAAETNGSTRSCVISHLRLSHY